MADFKGRSGVLVLELSGVSALLRTLNEARDFYTDAEVRAGYQGAAKGIADTVRRVAPQSKYPWTGWRASKKTSSRPGQLKRSIVGKAFNLASWRRWGPGAFAQVTLRRGATNRAPQANIVKSGRRALVPKQKQRMVFMGTGGQAVFARQVKAVPPNDFWRKGIMGAESRAIVTMRAALERAWNRRVK